MKPSELIEELKQYQEENVEDELDVEFAYDYGDHCHSTVTKSINTVEQLTVKYSGYHRKNCIIDDADEEETDGNEKEPTQVIVLQ